MGDTLNQQVGILLGKAIGELDAVGLRSAADALDVIKPVLIGASREMAHGAGLAAVLLALRQASTPSSPPPAPAPAAALAPAPPRRRRGGGRKPKPLVDAGGKLIPDWTDEDGAGYLCQRRAGEVLQLRRGHLIALEEQGRLLRVYADDGRRVGYAVARIEDLLAMLARIAAGEVPAKPPTEDNGKVADAA